MMDRIKRVVKEKWMYITIFVLPWVVLLIHSLYCKGWPLFEGSILRGDTALQLYPLCVELWEKVHSGDSLFYSWNAGGGYDFFLNMAYYLISPFTLLVLMVPRGWVEHAVQVIMILKWSCIGVSVVYYFMHTKHNQLKSLKPLVSFILGLAFTLSNYVLMGISYFNWNDVILLFPILLLLVERMVEKENWKLYYVLLTLAMLCNFYMAYQLCIFLFLWFLMQLKKDTHHKVRKALIFVGNSVLAAVSSLVVILPCVFGVGNRYSGDVESANAMYISTIIADVKTAISKLFIMDKVGEVVSLNPNLYFSVGFAVLLGFYVITNAKAKDLIRNIMLAVFMTVSIFVGALNFVWHGFSVPNGVFHRFLYLVVFVYLFLIMKTVTRFRVIKFKHVVCVGIVELILFVVGFFNVESYLNYYTYLITVLLGVFYYIILVLYCKKSITKWQCIITFCVVVTGEMLFNSVYQFNEYNIVTTTETFQLETSNELLELVKDDLRYGERVSVIQKTNNMGMLTGVPNDDVFVSYGNGNNVLLHQGLGMDFTTNAGYADYGMSPLLNLIFNVRYGISNSEMNYSDATLIGEKGDFGIYELQRLAGLGYMVNDDLLDWNGFYAGPFQSQNDFVKMATGESEIFEIVTPKVSCIDIASEIEPDEDYLADGYYRYNYTAKLPKGYEGVLVSAEIPEDMDLYIVTNHGIAGEMVVNVDGVRRLDGLSPLSQQTIHVGRVKKGQTVSVVTIHEADMNDNITMWYQYAKFNEENYQKAYDKLSRNVFEIDTMESDYIKGRIKADESGLMMTSVQAMEGFTTYVDGENVEYETVSDTMIALPLAEGEHIIEFCYETPYFKVGIICSCLAVFVFVLLCGIEEIQKRRKSDMK